jgi:cytochrome bd-type quinol oxidase subunit 2
MSTSSQKRAEEYREKVERFKRLKLISIITVITDLVMAVIWIFLFVKRISGMEFSQAVKSEPMYFIVCILFLVGAVGMLLYIPFVRKMLFKDFDGEDIVE